MGKYAYVVQDVKDHKLSKLRASVEVHSRNLEHATTHTRIVDGKETTCYQLGFEVFAGPVEDYGNGIYAIGDTLYGVDIG